MSERQTKAGNQECYEKLEKLSPTPTHTLSLSLSLSLSHSPTLDMLNNFCFHVYAQKSLSHFHTLTLSLSHSFNVSFNHSRHAEQVLFSSLSSKYAVYSRKLQCFFLTSSAPSPVT